MQPFELRGDGVLLAIPSSDDVETITQLCQDAEIQRWTTVPVPYRRTHAEEYLQVINRGWEHGTKLTWALRNPRDRAILGMVDLGREGAPADDDVGAGGAEPGTGSPAERDTATASSAEWDAWIGGSGEVGFWLSPAARGRGLMTTAVRLIAEYAFAPEGLGLGRMLWCAYVGNWASRRVAWRLGFSFEGTIRSHLVQRGERRDAWAATLLAGDPMTPARPWLDVPTLTGSSVVLRRFVESDADACVEACTDPVTRHWLGKLPTPYTRDTALSFIRSRENDHATGDAVYWAAAPADEGAAVGSFSVLGIGRRRASGGAAVGYWVHPATRGAGVATEAIQLMTAHAFTAESDGGLGLRRLVLACAEGNEASATVAKRAGFTRFGVESSAYRLGDGTFTDTHWYELLAR